MQNPSVGNILGATHDGLPFNTVMGNQIEAYTYAVNSMLWFI